MNYKLHPYQERIINKLLDLPHGALFLEMGLGKTAIILTLFKLLKERFPTLRALIVAPPAVASLTYPEEIKKWVPDVSYLVLSKYSSYKRSKIVEYTPHDICLSSNMGIKWLRKTGHYRMYDMLIVDESSTVFSKHDSMNFKALKGMLHNFIYRYIMTGTPVPNGYEQLWSQYYIVDLGQRLMTDFYSFRKLFFTPHSFNRFKWSVKKDAVQEIQEKTRDITLALRMKDVALELPPLTHTIIPTDLPSDLEDSYYNFKKEYMLTCAPDTELHYNKFTSDTITILADTAALLVEKLLQFCSGAIYTKEDPKGYVRIHDLKARALGNILSEHEGKALLLYRYRHERELILDYYPDDVVSYNGDPNMIQRWQAGETPRILMSHPRSIATGLNLQHTTDTIIWLGFTWDFQQWQQTNARLHRPGQEHAVRCLYLATGEMEYQLLTRLKDKDAILQGFMERMKVNGLAYDILEGLVTC